MSVSVILAIAILRYWLDWNKNPIETTHEAVENPI